MKVSILIILFTLLILTACEVIAPNMSTSGKDQLSLLRSVNVKCEISIIENCNDEGFASEEVKVYGYYTQESCRNIDHNTDSLVKDSTILSCTNNQCNALLKDFKERVDSGTYTFYAFIDVNHNEALDIDEPFFCSDEVSIIPEKKIINLEVSFLRNFRE